MAEKSKLESARCKKFKVRVRDATNNLIVYFSTDNIEIILLIVKLIIFRDKTQFFKLRLMT